jgi:hypothetical protein
LNNDVSNDSLDSLSSLLESIVHTYSPSSFSLIDKSELYETCFSLTNGITITQIEQFYLLHQQFDRASSSNFPLQNLLSTLAKFSAIPYNQDFHLFLSRFLKTFCFQNRLHQYFYRSTDCKRSHDTARVDQIGTKTYGIDHLPVMYDLKFEQERPIQGKHRIQ